MTIGFEQLIFRQARFHPDKPALVFSTAAASETLSYAQLHDRVARTVTLFTDDLGLQRGQRIAWLGLNHPEMLVALLAAAHLGVIVVPLNWRLSVQELAYMVSDAEPVLLLYGSQHAAAARQLQQLWNQREMAHKGAGSSVIDGGSGMLTLLPLDAADSAGLAHRRTACRPAPLGLLERRPASILEPGSTAQAASDGACLLVYRSGTTGRPKGAVLTQQAMLANAVMSQHMHSLSSSDRVLTVLPLFHVGGLNIQTLPALMHGATVILHDSFEPQRCLQSIAHQHVTLMVVVPTVLQALLQCPAWAQTPLQSLRLVAIGSTDVPRELIQRMQKHNVPLVQVYGATETGPICIYQLAQHAWTTAGSIGQAGLLCDIALLDTQGQQVATGTAGEICVRSDNLACGYWRQPEATAEAFRDGWFHTGDVASLDADGNYWFCDRIKYVIISGGENIYPAEIERVLRSMTGATAVAAQLPATVTDVAVVGQDNARWGQVPVAVLALGEGLIAGLENPQPLVSMLQQVCAGNLARFKQPRAIYVMSDFPRNALGKVLVPELRRCVDAAVAGPDTGIGLVDMAQTCYKLH